MRVLNSFWKGGVDAQPSGDKKPQLSHLQMEFEVFAAQSDFHEGKFLEAQREHDVRKDSPLPQPLHNRMKTLDD